MGERVAEQHDDASPGDAVKRRTELPRDRFDSPPRDLRVGAHRANLRPRRFVRYLIGALIGIVVLTGIGIVYVQFTDASVTAIFDPGSKDTATVSRVTPKIDPKVTVAVLNGTATPGLQDAVGSAITEGKWGSVKLTDVAASTDVKISAVFYASKADEPAALALAKELGGVSTYKSTDYQKNFGVQRGVLLGADYAGPGASPASSESPAQ